jgi:hypothetical protein
MTRCVERHRDKVPACLWKELNWNVQCNGKMCPEIIGVCMYTTEVPDGND